MVKKQLEQVQRIKLSLIDDSPTNPPSRLRDIDVLAKSIQAAGEMYEPIKVARSEISGRYIIEDGHRRKYAAIELKWLEVPVIVKKAAKVPALVKLATGLTQERLTPWETTQLIADCLQEKVKQKEIAAYIGRSEGFISKFKTIIEAAAKASKDGKEPEFLSTGKKFADYTSYEDLYNDCQALLHPEKPKKKKTEQGSSQVDLVDSVDKEARQELAGKIAEQFKLPADNVDVVHEKDGMVAVIMAFSSLNSAKKAFRPGA